MPNNPAFSFILYITLGICHVCKSENVGAVASRKRRGGRCVLLKGRLCGHGTRYLNYIRTLIGKKDTGNKVCKQASLPGSQNIILGGKTIIEKDVTIRGDLLRGGGDKISVAIGRFCVLEQGCEIRPPKKLVQATETHFPVSIGDFVSIGRDALVEATSISNQVVIGAGARIGAFCSLKEGCVILPASLVAPNTTIDAWCVYGGVPAMLLGEVFPKQEAERQRRHFYDFFVGK